MTLLTDQQLLEASRLGRLADVKRLLKQGANLDAVGVEHKTALYLACEYQHDETAKLLITSGA